MEYLDRSTPDIAARLIREINPLLVENIRKDRYMVFYPHKPSHQPDALPSWTMTFISYEKNCTFLDGIGIFDKKKSYYHILKPSWERLEEISSPQVDYMKVLIPYLWVTDYIAPRYFSDN